MKKTILTIIITAIIAGGGVYIWQNNSNNTKTPLSENKTKSVTTNETVKATETNIVDVAKKSKDKFLYLVSSPSLAKTQMLLKDYFVDFSFEYTWGDWGEIYYKNTDLTASGGGGGGIERFDELGRYDFCAGGYFCDMKKQEGKGFQMQIWNANYSGAKKDPNFFQKSGEKLVKKTDKIIITYKSYKGGKGFDIPKDVAKLFESFKVIK